MCNKVYKTIVLEACILQKCLIQPSGQKRVSVGIDAFHFNHVRDLRGDGRDPACACACEDRVKGAGFCLIEESWRGFRQRRIVSKICE
jgi:hypothetical protein